MKIENSKIEKYSVVLIDQIHSREILDSRGFPTLETRVVLSDGTRGVSSVPSGTSRGRSEALELRDKDYGRYFGEGVTHAVTNVNEVIAPRLKKMNPLEQEKVDQRLLELDQTPNKAHLGANSILSVSLANCVAAANLFARPLFLYLNELFIKKKSLNQYEELINLPEELMKVGLPCPLFNLVNGGKHADNPLKFQEYAVVPIGIGKMAERIRAGAEIDRELRNLLMKEGIPVAVGEEGGFAPHLKSDSIALEFLAQAVTKAGYKLEREVVLALDLAASHFFNDGEYQLPLEGFSGNAEELFKIYQGIITQYPIFSMEDPLAEDDWEGWKSFKAQFGEKILVVSDDLTATQRNLVLKALEENAINAVVIKPNQIGTLSETLDVIKLAKYLDFTVFISHRSGETNDTFVADLAVAVGAPFLKAGAPVRGERVAKYNRLMEVAEEIE